MKKTHERNLEKMEEELELAGYSPRTVDSYLGATSRFLRHVDKPASRLGAGDLREYFLFLADEKKAASSTINPSRCGRGERRWQWGSRRSS